MHLVRFNVSMERRLAKRCTITLAGLFQYSPVNSLLANDVDRVLRLKEFQKFYENGIEYVMYEMAMLLTPKENTALQLLDKDGPNDSFLIIPPTETLRKE